MLLGLHYIRMNFLVVSKKPEFNIHYLFFIAH